MRNLCFTVLFFFKIALSINPAFSESDGEEFLAIMENEETLEIARAHIDDVWKKWDGTLFCIGQMEEKSKSEIAMVAVKTYLESNKEEHFRPRRYLIIQGLRTAFLCD